MSANLISAELKDETMKWVYSNPYLAGIFAIVGFSLHARITKLVQCLFDFIQDLLIVTYTLTKPDEAYVCFLYYMHEHPDRNTVLMTEENLQIETRNTSWYDLEKERRTKKQNGVGNNKLVKVPGQGFHFMSISSMWIIANICKNQIGDIDNSSITITTFTWNRKKLDAFLEKLIEDTKPEKNMVKIYLPSNYHSNNGHCFRFKRSIEKHKLCHSELPILPENIKEELLNDAKTFLESEEYYDQKGLNWSRGYAFLGKPGNGKSSISKWLACKLNMNLCIIKEKIYKGGSFASLMENCPENSIIVIEDFDTLFDIEKRTGENNKNEDNQGEIKKNKNMILKEGLTITLGEILNAIESPLRKRKTIFTFSSNMQSEIDPALLRPGRIDKIIHLPDATFYQIKRFFLFHFPGEKELSSRFAKMALESKNKLSMAEIRGLLMYRDPERPFQELKRKLSKEKSH